MKNDQHWEGNHIEAPTLIKKSNKYFLFYSAGGSTKEGYSVSYATADNIFGPYRKTNKTIIGGNACMKGSGHQSIVQNMDDTYTVYYHSVKPERRKKKKGKSRFVDYSYLCFKDNVPIVQDARCGK